MRKQTKDKACIYWEEDEPQYSSLEKLFPRQNGTKEGLSALAASIERGKDLINTPAEI